MVQLYKESVLPWRKAQDARPEVKAEYALLRALYGDTPHGRAVTGEDVGRATQGQAVRDPSMTARDVEHVGAGPQPEGLPENGRLRLREIVGQRALVEVEIVLAEDV